MYYIVHIHRRWTMRRARPSVGFRKRRVGGCMIEEEQEVGLKKKRLMYSMPILNSGRAS